MAIGKISLQRMIGYIYPCTADDDAVQKPNLTQSHGADGNRHPCEKFVERSMNVCWSRLPYVIALVVLVIAVGMAVPLYHSLHGK